MLSPGGYTPPFYEEPRLAKNREDLSQGLKYADPPQEALTAEFVDKIRARETFENGGKIMWDDATGLPRNPRGRTGVCGRGELGQWGPNHAADPIVTRKEPLTGSLQVRGGHVKPEGELLECASFHAAATS